MLRPAFKAADAATILAHVSPGTLVDFDGYRATSLWFVEPEDAPIRPRVRRDFDDDDDEDDDDDGNGNDGAPNAEALLRAVRRDGKRFTRIVSDVSYAGYGEVPGRVVAARGLPALQNGPLGRSLGTYVLPGVGGVEHISETSLFRGVSAMAEDEEGGDYRPSLVVRIGVDCASQWRERVRAAVAAKPHRPAPPEVMQALDEAVATGSLALSTDLAHMLMGSKEELRAVLRPAVDAALQLIQMPQREFVTPFAADTRRWPTAAAMVNLFGAQLRGVHTAHVLTSAAVRQFGYSNLVSVGLDSVGH